MKFAKLSIFMLAILTLAVAVAAQPTVTSIGDQSVDEGQELSISVTATTGTGDNTFGICQGTPCEADETTVTLAGSSATITKVSNTQATLTWTPNFNAAAGSPYTINVSVTDDDGNVAFTSFEVDVTNVDAQLTASNLLLGGENQARSNSNHDDEDEENVNASGTITLTNSGGETLTDITATIVSVGGFTTGQLQGSVEFANGITSLAPGESVQVTVRMRVPESLDSVDDDGDEVTPRVADIRFTADELGSTFATSQVSMQAENQLDLDRVEIRINGDSERVRDGDTIEDISPGDSIEVEITVENLFRDEEDVEIEDIEILLESDDELDIDEDDDIDRLRPERKETITLSFDIDEDADEVDEEVILRVVGIDEFGALHGARMEFTLEVVREDHEIIIRSISVNPSTISCEEQVVLTTNIRNTGRRDEDEVFIRVQAPDLGFNRVSEVIELDEDDSTSRSFSISVPDNLATGGHRITVETYYDSDELSERDGVILTKTACQPTQPDEPDDEPDTTDDDVVVVVQPPVNDTPQQPTTDDTDEARQSFIERNWVIGLLILAYIIVIGAGIAIIVRLLRK